MKYWTLGHRLPELFSIPLFGNRKAYGYQPPTEDPDWEIWRQGRGSFYQDTQQTGVGKVVNHAGYRILDSIDLTGKRILEIGPGNLPHLANWRGKPASYTIADNNQAMLEQSTLILGKLGIPTTAHLIDSHHIPEEDEQFDLVISFYTLEHMYPLKDYLKELERLLCKGGLIAGGIPTEGGLAWGLGRFLTSRRYILHNLKIDPDKIIPWVHPNFAEVVLKELDQTFTPIRKKYWPFGLPFLDINLVVSFLYKK